MNSSERLTAGSPRTVPSGLVPLAVHQRATCCRRGREVVFGLAPSVRAPRRRNRLSVLQLPVLAVHRGLCRWVAELRGPGRVDGEAAGEDEEDARHAEEAGGGGAHGYVEHVLEGDENADLHHRDGAGVLELEGPVEAQEADAGAQHEEPEADSEVRGVGRVGLEGPVDGERATALDEGDGEGQDDAVEAHPGAEEEVVDADAHAADGDGEHAGEHAADDGEGRAGGAGGVDGGAGGLLPGEGLDDEEHADE
mmetsp:Transcript_3204/g.7074  ORF Transcript_3204/g.7074 Transcript_3204/m.7074 type:complete len:252 (-) Transcript_3204:747-1502(-)